jgi:monooxygenase
MPTEPEHVDVLIVGAGLSGIGAAHHLQDNCPGKSYAILESRDRSGGTWDLFRYPGIRSDSDMFTLGYSFRPWLAAKSIADGPDILSYVRDTAREGGIDENIRFKHKVVRAEWSTADSRWTVESAVGDSGDTVKITAQYVFMCTGYYRYDEGYTPEFAGTERFGGDIVHPQLWPEDLDYAGKRVVVIGSGATAVTLVPAMAATAGKVTMLQRSPSYIFTLPAEDPIAKFVRKILPPKIAYPIVRWKNVAMTTLSFQVARWKPSIVKNVIRRTVERQLPADYDVDKHFKPTYNPWDQRICLVPNGDLFRAIRKGTADVVTDHIDTFTETGIKLRSGEELEADVIITATGLNLLALGGMEIGVDGEDVNLPDRLTYKGMMLEGVPNLGVALGYTNASWTLKCDLTCEYMCRVINHCDANGYTQFTPENSDPSVTPEPFIDFNSGYVQRSIHKFPKQGSRAPWRLYQNYARDIVALKYGSLDDEAMVYSRGGAPAGTPPERVAA